MRAWFWRRLRQSEDVYLAAHELRHCGLCGRIVVAVDKLKGEEYENRNSFSNQFTSIEPAGTGATTA